jgi:hypothetical protein
LNVCEKTAKSASPCKILIYPEVQSPSTASRQLAPQHPEWKTKEPFASLLKGDVKSVLFRGNRAMLDIVMATHAGMTTEEFEKIVTD